MQDFFAALIAFFLVKPLQQEIAETLAVPRAPQEITWRLLPAQAIMVRKLVTGR